jgi:type I restriction enzyme S subunit
VTNWPKVQVSQLGGGGRAFAMGPFGSRIKTENFRSAGVPVLRGKNLGGNRFDDSDVVFVDQEKAEELSASIARPGDLVFTHRGTLGQVALIPRHSRYPIYLVSQSQMKATFDEERVLPEYVYY